MNKKIKGFFYSVPFVIASFLPSEKANAQIDILGNKEWNKTRPNDMEKPNTIYAGFQIIDLGASIGYSKKIIPNLGVYLSASKGKYRSPLSINKEEFKESYIDHYKISMGTNIHFNKDKTNTSGFISLGSSYSLFNKENYTQNNIPQKALKTWSLEAGAGLNLGDKLTVGFLFDPLKGESNVYLGVPF